MTLYDGVTAEQHIIDRLDQIEQSLNLMRRLMEREDHRREWELHPNQWRIVDATGA